MRGGVHTGSPPTARKSERDVKKLYSIFSSLQLRNNKVQSKTKPAWEQSWFTDGFWVIAVSWNIQVASPITSDKQSCFHKTTDETSLSTSLNLVNACLQNWKTRIIRGFLLKEKCHKVSDAKVFLLTVSFKDSLNCYNQTYSKAEWN